MLTPTHPPIHEYKQKRTAPDAVQAVYADHTFSKVGGKLFRSLAFLLMAAMVPLTAWAETVQIYQKTLPDHGTLIVTRTEVPIDKPSPQQVADTAKWLQDHPGLGMVFPKYAYLYQFLFTSAKKPASTILWERKEESFARVNANEPIPEGSNIMQILDASVQNDTTLIVLYQQDNMPHANIILPGDKGTRLGLDWKRTRLFTPVSGLDGYIESGEISGSLKAGDLSITLHSATNKRFVFHWKDQNWKLAADE